MNTNKFDWETIKEEYSKGSTIAELAQKYGCSSSSIYKKAKVWPPQGVMKDDVSPHTPSPSLFQSTDEWLSQAKAVHTEKVHSIISNRPSEPKPKSRIELILDIIDTRLKGSGTIGANDLLNYARTIELLEKMPNPDAIEEAEALVTTMF